MDLKLIGKLKRALANADVEYEITIEPEDDTAPGDMCDAETVAWIRDQLERGNMYAWCRVAVTARWEGFEGCDSLGGCSYESREAIDTMVDSDMKSEALIDLAHAIARAYDKINALLGGK